MLMEPASDVVILRQKLDQNASPILSKPLSAEKSFQTHKGNISHADIIGKRPRDVVKSSTGAEFRLHDVSLSNYVLLSRRLVTPIYPADANLIVSLFDIHASPNATDAAATEACKLEILEAGTGHGSLTLHLSRAIHAANAPKPLASRIDGSAVSSGADQKNATDENDLLHWKAERRAILHSIDVSANYSKHAAKTVRGFRRGIYADNVDFHVGDVSEWIESEIVKRNVDDSGAQPSTFLTHAFLDLPATETHLATVASAMHSNGILIIFNPSITQVAECVQLVKQESLPLHLEQVVELGSNGTSAGREWDVRAVKPRAKSASQSSSEPTSAQASKAEEVSDSVDDGHATRDVEQRTQRDSSNDWKLICRPKVGERITGGGFLGVFRKIKE